MKKPLLYAGMMFLFASLTMAQTTFSPTIMEITCPAEVGYDFGDEPLNINLAFQVCPELSGLS